MIQPMRRIIRATSIFAALAALAAPLVGPAQPAAAATRPFAATSPFNVAIKASPRIDPLSSAMVARLSRTGQAYANLYAYGIPIYTATASTPRYRVVCDQEGAWGECPLTQQLMPIPTNALPSTGTDGAMVVIDPASGTIGEYWQARRVGSGWQAGWGAVNSLSGSGWGGASTGAGASRLGGVVREDEIAAGVINHALVVQTDNACAGQYRAPAVKTDGRSVRSDCIPEGARIQLDPSISLSSISGLTPGERAVARALQVYGAYVIDVAGTSMSVSFERAADATESSPGATYTRAGLSWDYYGMPRVPWQRMRVLTTWQG
jgi:hypothetical protein